MGLVPVNTPWTQNKIFLKYYGIIVSFFAKQIISSDVRGYFYCSNILQHIFL